MRRPAPFKNSLIHHDVFDVFHAGALSRAGRRVLFRVGFQQVT